MELGVWVIGLGWFDLMGLMGLVGWGSGGERRGERTEWFHIVG